MVRRLFPASDSAKTNGSDVATPYIPPSHSATQAGNCHRRHGTKMKKSRSDGRTAPTIPTIHGFANFLTNFLSAYRIIPSRRPGFFPFLSSLFSVTCSSPPFLFERGQMSFSTERGSRILFSPLMFWLAPFPPSLLEAVGPCHVVGCKVLDAFLAGISSLPSQQDQGPSVWYAGGSAPL